VLDERGLSAATARRLVRLYGSEWAHVAGAGLDGLGAEGSILAGEAERAVALESARTVTDVLRRRTLAWAGPDRGRDAAEHVAAILESEGVDRDQAQTSIGDYEDELALHERWQD
jgi:glycerol-3-phosphate dehydrogenase